MEIEAIVFDMDGTIADTIPLTIHALKEAARELAGKEHSDVEIRREFGPTDIEIIKKLVGNEYGEKGPDVYIEHFKSSFDRLVKPIEGMNELLSHVRAKGIKLGLFTGRSLKVMDIILEKLGIRELFDIIIAGDMTRSHKPDPEGILTALDALHADCSRSMYVGDSDEDIAASKAAGVKSVLALWSSTGNEELIRLDPDMYYRSTYDFLEWLKRSQG